MQSSATVNIFFLVIVLATTFLFFKQFSSKDEDLAVCDRSTLENITVLLLSARNVSGNFYSLKNESFIFVEEFNVPVLCKGMIRDFPVLKDLSFQDGNLMKIEPGTFQFVDKLKSLSLQNNLLTTIQRGVFDPIKSLVEIYLGGNSISTIQQGAFSNMSKLRYIHLQNNKITSLNGNIFNGCSNLRRIYLFHNQITKIDKNAFNDLKSVEGRTFNIDLSNNSIEHFDARCLQDISVPVGLELELNKIADYTDIILNCKDGSIVNLQNNRISYIPDELIHNLASREIFVLLGENNLSCNIHDRVKDMDDLEINQLHMNLRICSTDL